MNVLELFAGSRSFGKMAEAMGHNVFSVDWDPYDDIDLVVDIGTMTKDIIPFVPDIIWASPDCKTYTISAISTHRNGIEPKTDYASKCDQVNKHFIGLIFEWLQINPNLKFFIENPRGMMRKMPFVLQFDRATVTYCKYGDNRMKPTDIFSNHIRFPWNPDGWRPREMCYNGNKNCHHEPAPRGSKTGTQGRKGSYDRSKIPQQLCKEILESCLPLPSPPKIDNQIK